MTPVNFDQIALAVEQLDVAIEMFLNERSDVSALTLAGAAEEILGNAIRLAGGQNALQQSYEVSSLTHRYLNGKELKWSEFSERENYARNGAKHLLRNGGKLSDVELRRSAIWMIARACANYEHLGHERTDRMRDFDNWFYEHEVGM